MKVGLDVGSTTIKCVVLDDRDQILYSTYERHYSHILEKTQELLRRVAEKYGRTALLAVSGSAGMGMAEGAGVPFVQEVFATRVAANRLAPGTDTVIELGGEDAKILFLTGGTEVRMNGSCAGGTGAFIDQMASLLKMSADEMDAAAAKAGRTYTIASRCGVFAKSDVQPLINQGARAGDIAASIYQAVVNQTIAGLAQGRPIRGNVLYLGGPLTFSRVLRDSFDKTLGVRGTCPENSLLYVALGAAFYADTAFNLVRITDALEKRGASETYRSQPPLFRTGDELEAFRARHARASVPRGIFPREYRGPVHIGIDSGSTTVKLVVMDPEGCLLFVDYRPNLGNPVPIIRHTLLSVLESHPHLQVASVTTTGYGEELAKAAFHADYGVVETVAHFTAAKHFLPDVDFIIDIGGQDMKCFKIQDGAISDIFLNEACSSGCGSFLQTFAQALGYDVREFAKLGLFAERPVDLGSRCTVFMNSSVKQAQKDGATIENISAGLSISVVKNAIYKVIRASSPEELGRKIVVQGGTFYNEAVLRAFEQEMGVEVVRPDIAGLMGAYGAALYGMSRAVEGQRSTLLDRAALAAFRQETESRTCQLCGNHCQLTVSSFADGGSYISGNRCERPVTGRTEGEDRNLYAYKRKLILSYKPGPNERGKIGLPLCLNFWELYPFWHTFFTQLGFAVYHSPLSSRKLYMEGQGTIPSDTACFPAKLAHGHIAALNKLGLDAIFYPCLTYNLDEGLGQNHYNCPVVAYYPEVLAGNCPELRTGPAAGESTGAGKNTGAGSSTGPGRHSVAGENAVTEKNAGTGENGEKTPKTTRFIYDYLGIHRPRDFARKIQAVLDREFPGIPHREVRRAADAAYEEYNRHMDQVRRAGSQIMDTARAQGRRIVVLAGRPYHIDPEVNHGIDELIVRSGAAVVTEDAVSHLVKPFKTTVLNQWTYHARLYAAAKYCTEQPDMDLVHLVSFGCGVDAITSDETREILRSGGKLYTQLKIDEITNLGAVRIRLRSLFAALDEQERKAAARGVTASDCAAADAFARARNYHGAAYRGQWNGWQVYEPLIRGADGPERGVPVVGLPLVLLERDGKVHLSSHAEAAAWLQGVERTEGNEEMEENEETEAVSKEA